MGQLTLRRFKDHDLPFLYPGLPIWIWAIRFSC